MSALSDFSQQSMSDAMEVIGEVDVAVTGVSGSPKAMVDQFTATRELELGGFVGEYDATAVMNLTYLSGVTSPIERTLEGKTFTISGRTYKIGRVFLDEVAATFGLKNPNKIDG